ncbi:acetyl-coenzyme-A carboxylase, partial [Oleoguttula sp. CCFEE 5521]
EEVILALRDANKEKVSNVVNIVLSHTRVSAKNNLLVEILQAYRPNLPNVGNVAKYFKPSLQILAELEGRATAKVALKARELLIQCAMPSLEERTSQMEHILRSSVLESRYGESGWDHRAPNFDIIKEVVDSKYTVFDVLPQFFVHQDPWVSLAALEVYTRRAYRAYQLTSIDYVTENDTPYVLTWDFSLRKVGESAFGLPIESSHPSTPGTPAEGFARVTSLSDMSYLTRQAQGTEPTRKGAVVPVQYLDEIDEVLMKALEVFPVSGEKEKNGGSLMADLSKRRTPQAPKLESNDDLTAVCNVAVRDAESQDDKEILARLTPIVNEYRDELLSRRVRRLTFICGHKDGTYPGYYTFRGPAYEED